jgi:hypothetical protein
MVLKKTSNCVESISAAIASLFSFSLSLSLFSFLSRSLVCTTIRSACYKGTAVLLLLQQQSSSNEVKLWEQKGFSFLYLFIYQFLEVGGLAIFPKKS